MNKLNTPHVACSGKKAQYPRIREFAYSRALPTFTHVARGLVLICSDEGPTGSFTNPNPKVRKSGAVGKAVLAQDPGFDGENSIQSCPRGAPDLQTISAARAFATSPRLTSATFARLRPLAPIG